MPYFLEQYSKKKSTLLIIVLCFISAIIGGIISLRFVPIIYGYDYFKSEQPQLPFSSENKGPLSSGLDYSPVVDIAEHVGPTVVGISNQSLKGNIFSRELVEQGSGSGVIISDKGYIVTNYHVIAKAERIMVYLADGREVEAEVRGSDPDTDLAVLRINAGELPVSVLGDSDTLKVGELVVAIGNPLGYGFARSVTVGVISAKERHITIQDQKFKLIQTDAAINPGNSGGALVNGRGEIIGINSAKLVITGVEGMGFAIPISDAKPIINELIEKGYISRSFLGISGWEVDERTARYNEVPEGLYITEVVREGPAYKAGIKVYDILIGINEKEVISFEELSDILQSFNPGDTIQVNLFRRGKEVSIPLILGERRSG